MDITTISDIRLLVDSFYAKVKNDPTIGPVFNDRIINWDTHLQKMYRFWQTILLGEHTYGDSPFPVHAQMPIDATHFNRWIFLWHETVDEYFEGVVADEAKWRGDKMATVFLSKITYYRTNHINPML
ncbi:MULTISPECIES: group III truncated hemoglobin [Sphingobacterium]|uniref:group III truncated hemoglobin n=1 Tax=Sphingobacterium TaxID=28453 RepID=UPI002576AAD5|nr:group III truncated hemoglobin [Sphingobacterium sp. N143]MDM1294970.1 group III truncated hemoglobin [Sphingobacterium sp. N143]